MKFSNKLQTIIIKNIAGDVSPNKMAYLSDNGLFAVHRHFEFYNQWVVTHIPTGLKFPYEFDTQGMAKRFAREVCEIIDWSSIRIVKKKGKKAWIYPKEAYEIARIRCNQIASTQAGLKPDVAAHIRRGRPDGNGEFTCTICKSNIIGYSERE